MQDLSNKGFHSQWINASAEKHRISLRFEVGRAPGQPQQAMLTQSRHIKATHHFTQVLANWGKVYPNHFLCLLIRQRLATKQGCLRGIRGTAVNSDATVTDDISKTHLIVIYTTVTASCLPNFTAVQAPLPTNLHFDEWQPLVHMTAGTRVVD